MISILRSCCKRQERSFLPDENLGPHPTAEEISTEIYHTLSLYHSPECTIREDAVKQLAAQIFQEIQKPDYFLESISLRAPGIQIQGPRLVIQYSSSQGRFTDILPLSTLICNKFHRSLWKGS